MLARSALIAIGGYQQWISPRKGYACPYRLLHGGTGCSGFAKAALRTHGFRRAVPLIRARLHDCHAAALTLSARNRDLPKEPGETGAKKRKDRWYESCDCNPCGDMRLCGFGRGHDLTPDCAPDCVPDCSF